MSKISRWMSDKEYEEVTRMTPIPTVNLVILRKNQEKLEVLLLIRKTGYSEGSWCVIGGRVWLKETLSEAIDRHSADLGIRVRIISPFNSNFPSFIDDSKDQDKTKHPISLVYPAEIASGELRDEGDEYKGYKWFPISNLPEIAYGQDLQINKTLEILHKLNKNY